MARHNRNGTGVDQRGFHYRISYPPDWLEYVRVTRRLPSGRQSTRTIFRNPARNPEVDPGDLIKVRVESPEQDLVIETTARTAPDRLGEIVFEWRDPRTMDPRMGRITFTLRAFGTSARGRGGNGPIDYLSR